VSFLFLGLLDFDSFLLPKLQLRFYLALPFFIFGAAMGIWGSASFNLRSTLGLGDKLIITGPYKHTRNPQYIGDSSNIIGFMILTNSWMVWVIGILGVALNILAPFTEETWLEEIFGEEYTEYKRNVPRFFRFGGKDNSG
jgi:protein-S-isoprenylcysteine O-methyltransferase Ste14